MVKLGINSLVVVVYCLEEIAFGEKNRLDYTLFLSFIFGCRGLDESHFRKLFLRRNVMMLRKRDLERSKQPEPEPVTVEAPRDYDYDNENDASYCPNNVPVTTSSYSGDLQNEISFLFL